MGRTSPATKAESDASLSCTVKELLSHYPAGTLLRLPEVLRLIPVCRASWYNGIVRGDYPLPVRIGLKAVAWKIEDILELRERMVSGEAFGVPDAAKRHELIREV